MEKVVPIAGKTGFSGMDIGEAVDINLGRGPSYRTMVEDIDGDTFWVSAPFYRGVSIGLRQGQKLQMYYYRQNGRYCYDVTVTGFKPSGEITLTSLEADGPPRKQQRRDAFRYIKALQAIMYKWNSVQPSEQEQREFFEQSNDQPEKRTIFTENISEGGALLICRKQMEPGDKAYLKLFLNWPHGEGTPPIHLICEVRSCSQLSEAVSKYRVGVMFINMETSVRDYIAKYVLVQQQEEIRSKWIFDVPKFP